METTGSFFSDILDKLKSSFGANFVVSLPFLFSCVGVFGGGGMILSEKMGFAILVAFCSEPGPGSARNGFLAKNYVGLANYQPKRLSGRPFRGQNVFLMLGKTCFAILVGFLAETRSRDHRHETRLVLEMFFAGLSSKLASWETSLWPEYIFRFEFGMNLILL